MIPFTVMFEYQTTFAAFQLTDLSVEWRKYIEFHPFNFYEEWAKKLLSVVAIIRGISPLFILL